MDYVKYLRGMVGNHKVIMGAGGVILVRDNQILLQRRADNGLWGLIGGIMELEETFSDTAKREAYEETGCEVSLDYLVGVYHNMDMHWPSGDEAHVICAIYKASIISGEIRCDSESLELKFFSPEELPEVFAEDHREAIRDYLAGIKNHVI